MKHDQLHQDLATIGRNGIDRTIELARENERLLDCLRSAATTFKHVTNLAEAGELVPEWLAQDCRIALMHIGAVIKENTL